MPVLFAAGGAAAYALAFGLLRADGPAFVAKAGGYVQLTLTLVALGFAIVIGGSYSGVFEGDAVTLSTSVRWLVVAVAVGAACFGVELAIGHAIHAARRSVRMLRHPALEGGTGALSTVEIGITTFALVGVGLAVAEELLWRQVLIGWLVRDEGWSSVSAVVLSAALFGLNHYWFGLRNIVTKAIDGAAWGTLLVASGSVIVPVAAHITFQSLVWRRLQNQSRSREVAGANA